MATWNSRGLRGSGFEELINMTNDVYVEKRLALVQKIPTPITPIEIDKTTRHITLAYFEKDSTVDYIGVVQGIPICFDAKECHTDTFPMQNIHEHQVQFMEQFERQKGISFLLIHFTAKNEFYYLPFRTLKKYIERIQKEGHAKNFKYGELDPKFFLKREGRAMVHYLEGINLDLLERKNIGESIQ